MAPPYVSRIRAYERLVAAIGRGATREVEDVLGSVFDVKGSPSESFQLLRLAACIGRTPAAELLIAKGADVNQRFRTDFLTPEMKNTTVYSAHGEQSLREAARFGHIDVVLLLIRAGADVHATDIEGFAALHRGFNLMPSEPQAQCEIAEALLSAGADPRLTTIGTGFLPLHFAALRGNIGAIDLLLSTAPETIHQRSQRGCTALAWAEGDKSGLAVAHLIAAGASAQGCIPGGILNHAILNLNEDVVQAVIENAEDGDVFFHHPALSMAVFIGHARILRTILENDGERMKTAWARTNNYDYA